MRADPCLCFVERCGRPNEQDINAEQQAADRELGEGSVSDRLVQCFSKALWATLTVDTIDDNGSTIYLGLQCLGEMQTWSLDSCIIILQLVWLTGIVKLLNEYCWISLWTCVFLLCFRGDYDKYSEDPEFKPATRHTKELYEEVNAFRITPNCFIFLLWCYQELKFTKELDNVLLRVIRWMQTVRSVWKIALPLCRLRGHLLDRQICVTGQQAHRSQPDYAVLLQPTNAVTDESSLR